MAIDNFKKVEGNKGYLVDDKDRKIFEREISKGYFGINIGDTIEFILYDSNDNPLPQESAKGKIVRYIEYNDNTKKDYFGKTQLNKENVKSNQAEEFFVDVEKLIKEAGYTNGIFKSQVSLLNKRLGSEDRDNDKVWIHEISPSRTEIRILPVIDDTTGIPNSDLEERYNLFINEKTFLPDVFPFIDVFVEQFDVQKVIETMLGLKGSISSGQSYIKLIESEFKISNFELFIQQVKNKFVEATNHYKGNREYNILSNRYGQPKGIRQSLDGDINKILNTVTEIAGQCIEYYLPKRNIQEESSLTIEQQKTLDDVQQLLKTVSSNQSYKSTIPPSVSAKSVGCKDPNALNYNPNADIDDRSLCVYAPQEESFKDVIEPREEVLPPPPPPPPAQLPIICNDPNALNYGQEGVCIYPKPKPKPIEIFDDVRDINVRGTGFDDELPMENLAGIATIVNNQTVDRIINAQERLVGGTGDLSQVGGMVPGTSVVGVTNNVPVRSGGIKTTVPPNVVEPVIQVKKNIKEK